MNRTVVCPAGRFAGLWGHGAVGERHAVGGAVGLALVAVLVVDRVVFWLVALDLVRNKQEMFYTAKTKRTEKKKKKKLMI